MKPPTSQKVMERLVYEGLLLHNQFQGRRWRISLTDAFKAGEMEPRILELLPAILQNRPSVFHQWQRNISKFPDLKNLLETLGMESSPTAWRGIPIRDIQKTAGQIAKLCQWKRQKTRWRNINIRIAESELESLNRLAADHQTSKSALIRSWITTVPSALPGRTHPASGH